MKNRWVLLYWRALKRLIQGRFMYKASALAFATLLTIVPLVLLIVSLTMHFPMFDHIMDLARHYVLIHFMPSASGAIEKYLEGFSQQASSLPIWSFIFFSLTVLALAVTIEDSLSHIWSKEHKKKKRSIKIFHWCMVILTPCFIGLSVLVSSYIYSLRWFSDISTLLGLKLPLLAVFPFFLNIGILILFYTAVPSYHVKIKDSFIGGCTAAVLFEVGKKGFSFYVSNIHSYRLIYGAFAVIPMFLIWLYISWLIVLFGAVVVSELKK